MSNTIKAELTACENSLQANDDPDHKLANTIAHINTALTEGEKPEEDLIGYLVSSRDHLRNNEPKNETAAKNLEIAIENLNGMK